MYSVSNHFPRIFVSLVGRNKIFTISSIALSNCPDRNEKKCTGDPIFDLFGNKFELASSKKNT